MFFITPNKTKDIKKTNIENSNPTIPIIKILGFKNNIIIRKIIFFSESIFFCKLNKFWILLKINKLEKKLNMLLKMIIDKIACSLNICLKNAHINPYILLVVAEIIPTDSLLRMKFLTLNRHYANSPDKKI